MSTTIISGLLAALGGVGTYFTWKASSVHQRRLAEADLAKETAAREAKKAEIREAVYSNDDEKLNRIVANLLAPVLMVALCATTLVACRATAPATVYVPTDRKIETVTNSLGIACKAVPNAVFAEMLEKIQELKDLQTELKVDKRVSK